jgi:hypothetical protein
MSDVRRVWSAEEIVSVIAEGQDQDTDAAGRELASFLARCTRLMQVVTESATFAPGYGDAIHIDWCAAKAFLRAIDEEGDK